MIKQRRGKKDTICIRLCKELLNCDFDNLISSRNYDLTLAEEEVFFSQLLMGFYSPLMVNIFYKSSQIKAINFPTPSQLQCHLTFFNKCHARKVFKPYINFWPALSWKLMNNYTANLGNFVCFFKLAIKSPHDPSIYSPWLSWRQTKGKWN